MILSKNTSFFRTLTLKKSILTNSLEKLNELAYLIFITILTLEVNSSNLYHKKKLSK